MKNYRCLILLLPALIFSQMLGDYNHPELVWKTYETEHFIFHYHNGTERSTLRFAEAGEKVYKPVTELYRYEPPKKLHIIVADYDDTANGGAYYYTDKIVLWAPSFDTELRGNHYWYSNVFAHEFTHMVHLQVSRKTSQLIPGIYLQWTGYETEKREDVLTGFPNVLTSTNIPFNIIPPWFAEGIAQSQAIDSTCYDFWDSSRDMVFRERIVSGKSLRYEQLLDFLNKGDHEAETVYNTGYAFVRHIISRYGKDMLYDITKEMSRLSSFTFEQAVKKSLGKDADKLYDEFIDQERLRYTELTKNIEENLVEGKNISDSATVNFHPKFSPDGKYLAFLSNKETGEARYYRRNLYIRDLKTDSVKMIIPGVVFTSYSWAPDSKAIYFSRIDTYSIYGNQFMDIFVYDLEKKKEEKLTEGLRAANPAVSPDGRKIAFVASSDGTRNLFVYDQKSKTAKKLTGYSDGSQFFQPCWNKEGTKILIDKSGTAYGRDIVLVDSTGAEEALVSDEFDNRDPVFSDDGGHVYYSSDNTGIFNIYKKDLVTGEVTAVTNVRGGAFNPELKDSLLVYVNYKGIGTNLYSINESDKPVSPSYSEYQINSQPYIFEPDMNLLKGSVNYANDFEHVLLMPRIAFDDNKFKPGMYFSMYDFLEKISLFGGFGIAMNMDYDVFAMAEYKFLLPTLYGLGINVEKHDDNSFIEESIIVGSYEDEFGNDIPIYQKNDIDFTYNLKELDFGIKVPLTFMPDIITGKVGDFDFDGFFAYLRNDAKADYGDFILQYTYFKERSYNFNVNIDRSKFDYNYYINPRYGRQVKLHYSRHQTDFIQGFNLNSDYGTLQEDYIKYNYNFYSVELKEHFKLPFGSGMTVKFKGSILDDDEIDSFYYNYIGGITGLKGYSFYSIGGTKSAYSGLYLRFPVVERADKRFGFFNFKNLFAGVFAEAGMAWVDGDAGTALDDLKKNVGVNLRLFGSLFYGYPTALEFSAAYGLDKFTNENVEYGHEVRTYLTLLFDFPEF